MTLASHSSFWHPDWPHISTLCSSSTLSTTILTDTRALPRPKISQTDWQCSPFSMRYVEKSHTSLFPSLQSPAFSLWLARLCEQPHRVAAPFLIYDRDFCWRKFTARSSEKRSRRPLKWLLLCCLSLPAGFKSFSKSLFAWFTTERTLVSRGVFWISVGRGRHSSNRTAGIRCGWTQLDSQVCHQMIHGQLKGSFVRIKMIVIYLLCFYKFMIKNHASSFLNFFLLLFSFLPWFVMKRRNLCCTKEPVLTKLRLEECGVKLFLQFQVRGSQGFLQFRWNHLFPTTHFIC